MKESKQSRNKEEPIEENVEGNLTESMPSDVEMTPESEKVVTPEEHNELRHQLQDALAQVAEYKDGWQRAVADFSNYKKRIERDNAQAYQNALADIIKRYLPIQDDLERAFQSRPAGNDETSWAEGIELIHRKLQAILEAEGIKRIEAEGQLFDPNLHEAVSHELSEDHESGQIIAVVQQGYTMGERVIRPAQVRVAK